MTAVLRDNLQKIGFEKITSFPDGKSAWEYIKTKKDSIDDIYCLLTDIEMPKMDGLTLSRKIKEDDILNKIKVILFSSLIKEGVRRKAEKIGVEAQITKPDLKELIKVLKEVEEKGMK
jgi:two-component system chemotaxis response regulator CheV